MGDATVDPTIAAAESQLDRIDRDGQEDVPPGPVDLAEVEHDDAMHIEEAGLALTTDDIESLDPDDGPDGELADCIDAFNEAFNARDLDSLLDLVTSDCEAPGLGNDIDNLPEAIEDLWDRRPSTLLTRGEHDGRCLSVMWELADGSRWWRVATVHFDDAQDGQIGVIEFTDDPALLDEVETDQPDLDLDEGARWEEWDEGAYADDR